MTEKEKQIDLDKQGERKTEEKGMRPEISGQHKALILRSVESNLQSHSRPHPGKGGPAVGH